MKINYKDIFEFFRLALVSCLMEKEEMIQWADEELLTKNPMNNDVIELSLSGRLPYSQLIGLLNTFQGTADRELPVKLLFAYAISKYSTNIDQIQALISGFQVLKAENYCNKEVKKQLTALENHLACYKKSKLTLEELQNHLELFLNQYIEYQDIVASILGHTLDLY